MIYDTRSTMQRAARATLSLSVAAALVAAVSVTASAHDRDNDHDRRHRVTPPAVPAGLDAPAGNKAVLVGHATGTQDYICLPAATGFAWALFTPQATLFSASDKQLITHFFSLNPEEPGTIRAAWQDSRDASTVWAATFVPPSFDPVFVAPGAIPWLLLEAKGHEEGPRGGDELTSVTFIQRVNTQGGSAPSTGCSQASNVGAKAFVPYTADYFFYEKDERGRDY